jgi:alpha-L-fucosidase
LEYNNEPAIENNLVGKTVDGGFSMTPQNQNPFDETVIINKKEREGTVPEYTVVKEKKLLRWKIYIDEPGEKTVDISYSFQSDSKKSKISVLAADAKLVHNIVPTGKTIGEPNQNWIIDNFKSTHLGKINFPKKGIFTIELEIIPEKNDELKFQWIWLH